jgi:hypothetical protein
MYIFARDFGLFGRLLAWLKAPFRAGHDRSCALGTLSLTFPATLFLPRESAVVKLRAACNENQNTSAIKPAARMFAARLATIAKQNVPKLLIGKRAGRCAPAGKAIPKRGPRVLKSYRRSHKPLQLAGEMRVLRQRTRCAEVFDIRRDPIERRSETSPRFRRAA